MREETIKRKADEYRERFLAELGGEWEQLTEFKGSHEPVTAVHILCGNTRTVPARDFFRRGCPICDRLAARRRRAKLRADGHIKHIEAAYGMTAKSEYVDMRTPVLWECNSCGAKIEKTIENILFRKSKWGGGILCDCKIDPNNTLLSDGTLRIIKHLRDHDIAYMREKIYDGCCDARPLPFDFVIINAQGEVVCVIEHDGPQHFKPIEAWGGEDELQQTRRHDEIKTEWCKANGLPLLRVRFDSNIEQEVDSFLNSL